MSDSNREDSQFGILATSYDQLRAIPRDALEQLTDWVIRHTNAVPATYFLEAGIGTGRIASQFLERGYRYAGVDLSPAMLRVLRSHPDRERCAVVQGDARLLPFADSSFDIVLSVHLLYLVDGWWCAVSEIRRVLRTGGRYLHCSEHSTGNPAAEAITEKWQDMIREWAPAASWPAYTTDADVLAALRADGAVVGTATAAQWHRSQTLDQFLAGYAERMRPLYPHIEEERFARIVDDYAGWLGRTYPHGVTLDQQISFEVNVAQWPTEHQ